MTLDKVCKGEEVTILQINDTKVRQQAIRLGIYEGARFVCNEKISGGPVVLQGAYNTTAIGRRLSEKIIVELAQD